ncbi:MAG: tellurite resistance TerB family protein [Gammaproteobacteria bacterium]|nr:tellurite resistance TerB family protein [Gammaproteobacteria bacterium]
MNFTDILGSVMNQGMTRSGNHRIEQSVNRGNGLGDLFSSLGGGASGGGGLLGSLGKMAGSAMNSGPGGRGNPMVTGGLGALVGALLGGGGSSAKGALGGTALALLGSLAMKALQGESGSSTGMSDSSSRLMAGLRPPENEQEARQVESLAELTLKAMSNAAKADGSVDQDEIRRIMGKAAEDGLTSEEREFIQRELESPMDTAGLIRAVPNHQIATQIYAASLLAIEVDTDAEWRYLRELASGLGLSEEVTGQLHGALGVA